MLCSSPLVQSTLRRGVHCMDAHQGTFCFVQKVLYREIASHLFRVQIIRVFVESVLRYGLPVNFVLVMFKVRCCFVSYGVFTHVLTLTCCHDSLTQARRKNCAQCWQRSMHTCSRLSFLVSKKARQAHRKLSSFHTSRTPSTLSLLTNTTCPELHLGIAKQDGL